MNLEELIKLAERLELQSEDLNEVVHDLASSEAANVNNEGLDLQLQFIVRQVGANETQRIINELFGNQE